MSLVTRNAFNNEVNESNLCDLSIGTPNDTLEVLFKMSVTNKTKLHVVIQINNGCEFKGVIENINKENDVVLLAKKTTKDEHISFIKLSEIISFSLYKPDSNYEYVKNKCINQETDNACILPEIKEYVTDISNTLYKYLGLRIKFRVSDSLDSDLSKLNTIEILNHLVFKIKYKSKSNSTMKSLNMIEVIEINNIDDAPFSIAKKGNVFSINADLEAKLPSRYIYIIEDGVDDAF